MGAVRNCMSKTYEQGQLVEPRDWENSRRERLAIGPRKGNANIVNLDAAWRLDCGADARLALCNSRARTKVPPGKLNVDFVCAGRGRAFHRRTPRLDGGWTSFASQPPAHPNYIASLRYGWRKASA